MSHRTTVEDSDPLFQLLSEIEARPEVSQRSMAARLGIALGLTNSLMQGLVRRGWVRVNTIKPNRVRYLITPTGIAEKARLSQQAFRNSVARYRVARQRVEESFRRVSAEWPGPAPATKPVVFYGTGEVAEIGFICLQETDLSLVAVIDDQSRGRFFGVPVLSPAELTIEFPASAAAACIIVMSLAQSDTIRADLAAMPVSIDRVIWV